MPSTPSTPSVPASAAGNAPLPRRVGAVISGPGATYAFARFHGADLFTWPGGALEPGERPRDAIARTLGANLGLLVEPDGVLAHGRYTVQSSQAADRAEMVNVYSLAVPTAETVHAQGEIAEVRWLTLGKAHDELGVDPITDIVLSDIRTGTF